MNASNRRNTTATGIDQVVSNRRTVEKFLAGTHSENVEDVRVIDETVDPSIRCHGFPGGQDPVDRDSYKEFFRVFRRGFTNTGFESYALVADEEYVAARFRVDGDHTGEFAGIQGDGRRVSFDGMALYRLRNGLITETWLQLDERSLFEQIATARTQSSMAGA